MYIFRPSNVWLIILNSFLQSSSAKYCSSFETITVLNTKCKKEHAFLLKKCLKFILIKFGYSIIFFN